MKEKSWVSHKYGIFKFTNVELFKTYVFAVPWISVGLLLININLIHFDGLVLLCAYKILQN